MRHLNLFENYFINPSFIKLKRVLEVVTDEIYPSYTITFSEETKESWSTICIKDENENIFLSFVLETKYVEINSNGIEELSNYIANLMNINENWWYRIEIKAMNSI